MTEENVLNQEQDTTSEDLFTMDSVEIEDSGIPTETNETEQIVDDKTNEEDTQQVAGSHEETPFMTIKYNKEAKNLSKDEAITLAQKGMNYDEIYSRYETLKGNEGAIGELDRLAKANGMSVDDYLKNLSDVQTQFELNKEIEALREKYPNSDDELLKELAETHMMNNANLESRKAEEQENAKRQEIGRQMDVFTKRYPDIDPSKLDKEVYALMNEGYTLLEAYETHNAGIIAKQEETEKSQEKFRQKNEENKAKSLGNLANQESADLDDAALFAKYMGL